ncbi:Ocs element-binding factor 1 [Spatholobus suberectus]|nr:Ocs element-binding factor 1 [Spatholobus suberectus]
MASIQRLEKSEYEEEDPQMDEMKIKKRRERDREYARQSRMRKQKKLQDLTNEVNKLQSVNMELTESIKAKEEAYAKMEASNKIFRAQYVELADRLRFLKMIEVAEEVKKLSVEIPDLKP